MAEPLCSSQSSRGSTTRPVTRSTRNTQPCMKAREKNSDSRRTSGVSASDVSTETDALDDPPRGNPGSKLDPEDSPGRNPDPEGTIGVDPGEPTPEGHSNLSGAVNRSWGRSNSTHSVGGDEAKQGSTCAQPAAPRSPEAHRISGKRAKGNRGVNYRSKDAKIMRGGKSAGSQSVSIMTW